MKKFILWFWHFFSLTTPKKLIKIMKLSIFLTCIFTVNMMASVYSQNTKFNLEINNQSIREVLKAIENQSQFRFFYNDDFIDLDKKVVVSAEDMNIDNLLSLVLNNTDVGYQVMENNFIVLTPKEYLQQIKVTGTITDATTGEPLPGVYIRIDGTSAGAVTGADGKYSIEIPAGDITLQYSFIGYITENISVEGRTVIDLALTPEISELEEVVVVGYGVQKKSNVTGAISSVKSEDIADRSLDGAHALQGKVSGLQVLSLSAAPGASATFRVRGYSSTSTSSPLFIVDGLKVADIGYLDPKSISSIEVLKDAASAAIYGAEAGNGVVIVTTQKGQKGKSRMFYDMQYSIQSVANKIKLMNATQFQDFWTATGADESLFQNGNTDWQDVLFDKGYINSHTLGFEGGNDKGAFFVSLNYRDNNGMVVGNKDVNKQLSAQLNASYQIEPWLKISTNNTVRVVNGSTVSANAYDAHSSVIGSVFFYDPTVPVYYADDLEAPASYLNAVANGEPVMRNSVDQLYGTSLLITDMANPMGLLNANSNINRSESILGTLVADFTPFKNFTFTSRLGYTLGASNYENYLSPYYWSSSLVSENPTFYSGTTDTRSYQWENFANYLFNIGNHELSAMAGMQYSRYLVGTVRAGTDQLINTDPNFRNLNGATTTSTKTIGGNDQISANMSYFGRLAWSYANKYMIQGNFRADAYDASKLSAKNRWGYFPSFSAGWVLSNEDFIKNLDLRILSYLKIRGSWGINGYINSLSDYKYTTNLTVTNSNTNVPNYTFTDTQYVGADPSDFLPNEDLTWEQSKQIDIGLDARFFRDRLTFGFDYFRKITDGMLTATAAPAVSGASYQWANIGKILNRGFEYDLSWKDRIGNFSYGIEANLSTLYNEVLVSPYGTSRYPGGGGFYTEATYLEAGYPLWYLRTNVIDHIDRLTGQVVYKTAEQLGTDDGKAYQGSAIPDFTYGITLTANYKNFDLTVFGSGVQGSEMFIAAINFNNTRLNYPWEFVNDSWNMDNINATQPGAATWTNGALLNQYASSDAFVFNSSYFKIKQIQLGYKVPTNLTSKIKISSLRIFGSLENFFTFTNYPGVDPESMTSTTGGSRTTSGGYSAGGGMGVDHIQYPSMKQVLFGVNVSF